MTKGFKANVKRIAKGIKEKLKPVKRNLEKTMKNNIVPNIKKDWNELKE